MSWEAVPAGYIRCEWVKGRKLCLIAAVDWGILTTYSSADLLNLHSGGRDEFFPL